MIEIETLRFTKRSLVTGIVIEGTILFLICLMVLLPNNEIPALRYLSFVLLIVVCVRILCEIPIKHHMVEININGIRTNDNMIEWKDVRDIVMETNYGTQALRMTIIQKNERQLEFDFYSGLCAHNSLFIYEQIILLSKGVITPRVNFWIKYVNFPFCRFIKLFIKKK